VWVTLAQLWQLEADEARRCWLALSRATWTVSAGFRQRLVLFEGQPVAQRLKAVDSFVRQHLPPQEICAMLAALQGEGLLSGPDRRQIEEKVLRAVDKAGAWTYPQLTEGVCHG
jgi:hypothetical protein